MAGNETQRVEVAEDALDFIQPPSADGAAGSSDNDEDAIEDPTGKGGNDRDLQKAEMFRPLKRPVITTARGSGSSTGKRGTNGPRDVVRLTPGANTVDP
jgi:hypothetical protein